MKFVNFNKLTIQNFLSIGNEAVEVEFRPGLGIITGINKDKVDRRNGVGKSTIADALHFAMFGSTIRDINKEFVKNNSTSGKTEVSLDFDIQEESKCIKFKIIRTIGPTKVRLFVDGIDRTLDSISNTDSFLHKALNVNPEIFQNCIALSINNTIPFMAMKKPEKKKFIESIFNLRIFSDMFDLLKKDYSEAKKTLEVENGKLNEAERAIKQWKTDQEERDKDRVNRKQKYLNQQKDLENSISTLEKTVNEYIEVSTAEIDTEIKGVTEKLTNTEDALLKISTFIAGKDAEIKMTEKVLKSIGTDKDTCPVCLTPIKEHEKYRIDLEKNKLQLDIQNIKQVISDTEEKRKKAQTIKINQQNKIKELNNKLSAAKLSKVTHQNNASNLSRIKVSLASVLEDIKNLEEMQTADNNSTSVQQERVEALKQSVESIKMQISILDGVKFVVSEEGIKAFIIKKIIEMFNNKIAYYLSRMDANCSVTFDEYFDEVIVNQKDKPCVYHNFSGAEKKNIDFACMFAFMDIRRLQGDIHYNLALYDELLDSSLDEKGIDLVLDILKERIKKYNESVYIISHRKESIKSATGDIIFLEKKNDITRRVDFKQYA